MSEKTIEETLEEIIGRLQNTVDKYFKESVNSENDRWTREWYHQHWGLLSDRVLKLELKLLEKKRVKELVLED